MTGNVNPKLLKGFEAIAIYTVLMGFLHVFSLTKRLPVSIYIYIYIYMYMFYLKLEV